MASWLKGAVGKAVGSAVDALGAAPSLTGALAQLQTAAHAVASSSAVQQLHDRLSGSHELHFAVVRSLTRMRRQPAAHPPAQERVHAAVAAARGADRLALMHHWMELLKGGRGGKTGEDKESGSAYPPASVSFYEARAAGPAPISFREVLLASRAAEALSVRLVEEPLPFEEERRALAALLALLLVGGEETAAKLLEQLQALGSALAGCGAEVRAELAPLAHEAVAALKVPPEEESCRSAALRASLALAEASASAEGDGEAGCVSVLPAARSLHVALARSHQLLAALAAAAPLQARSEALSARCAEASHRLAVVEVSSGEASSRVAESEKLLADKLGKSDDAASALQTDLAALHEASCALRVRLAAAEEAEARCAAKLAALLDERQAFAAGLTEALQALSVNRGRLLDERGGLGERTKALAAAAALVDAVATQRASALERATREALQAASTGAAKHLAALLGRCASRSAEAGLLLSRLRFCCASMAESARKQAESAGLGLLDVAAEARAQRLTLQRQYDEAEGAMRALLAEAAALRGEAAALDGKPSAAQAEQLAAALAQLAAADAEFGSREQPQRIHQPELEVDVVMERVPDCQDEQEEVAAAASEASAAPSALEPAAKAAVQEEAACVEKAAVKEPEEKVAEPKVQDAAPQAPSAGREEDEDWGL